MSDAQEHVHGLLVGPLLLFAPPGTRLGLGRGGGAASTVARVPGAVRVLGALRRQPHPFRLRISALLWASPVGRPVNPLGSSPRDPTRPLP